VAGGWCGVSRKQTNTNMFVLLPPLIATACLFPHHTPLTLPFPSLPPCPTLPFARTLWVYERHQSDPHIRQGGGVGDPGGAQPGTGEWVARERGKAGATGGGWVGAIRGNPDG
jgi:hypothetical protein